MDRNPPPLSDPKTPPTPVRIPLSLHPLSSPYAVGIQAMSSKSFMPLRGGAQMGSAQMGQARAMFMSARGGGGGPASAAISLASCDVAEIAETAAAPAGHVGTFATMSLAASDSVEVGMKMASAGVASDSPMGESPESPKAPKGRAVDHVDILAWQTAGGAWRLDARLLAALTENGGVDRERVEGEGKGAEGEVWATALALALLEQRWGGFLAEWQAGAEKGERWMRRAIGGEETKRWREKAIRVVKGEREEKGQATQ